MGQAITIASLHHVEVSIVKCNSCTGAVEPDAIKEALRSNTILVSVMLANNETGVIQPVREIVEAVRKWEEDNGMKQRCVLVHTDAAQVCVSIVHGVCILLSFTHTSTSTHIW